MESYERYGKLRDRCLRHWNLHPDSSGSVADLWHKNSNVITESSAPALFADAVDLIDIQRRELEAARSVIAALMPKLPIEGLTVDHIIAGALLRVPSTDGSKP